MDYSTSVPAGAKYSVTVIVTGSQKSSELPSRDDLDVLFLEDLRAKWEAPLLGSDTWWGKAVLRDD
jgi:hypothetical protein